MRSFPRRESDTRQRFQGPGMLAQRCATLRQYLVFVPACSRRTRAWKNSQGVRGVVQPVGQELHWALGTHLVGDVDCKQVALVNLGQVVLQPRRNDCKLIPESASFRPTRFQRVHPIRHRAATLAERGRSSRSVYSYAILGAMPVRDSDYTRRRITGTPPFGRSVIIGSNRRGREDAGSMVKHRAMASRMICPSISAK